MGSSCCSKDLVGRTSELQAVQADQNDAAMLPRNSHDFRRKGRDQTNEAKKEEVDDLRRKGQPGANAEGGPKPNDWDKTNEICDKLSKRQQLMERLSNL